MSKKKKVKSGSTSNSKPVVQKNNPEKKKFKQLAKVQKVKNKQNIRDSVLSKSKSKQNVKDNVASKFKNKQNAKSNFKINPKNKQNLEDKTAKVTEKSKIKKINLNKLSAMLQEKERNPEAAPKKDKKREVAQLPLRERMLEQLRSSRFRFLNEQLYSSKSSESKKYFQEDPQAFYAYHEGFKKQVEQWPMNPLDVIIESIKKM